MSHTETKVEPPAEAEYTTIVAVDKHKLAEDKKLVDSLLSMAETIPCDNAEQEAWWVEKLAAVHALITELEEEREVLVRPLLRDKKLVDAAFKVVTGPAESVKEAIKAKLAKRQEALRLEQTAAQEAARLVAEAGDHAACAVALAAIPESQTLAGAKTQWLWEAEVVDAASLPRQYLMVDERALAKYAKAFADQESIPPVPGVKFVRKARVSAKGKK